MIALPEIERAFEFENGFYLTCSHTRIGKLLVHYEFYKAVRKVPGAIV